MPENFEIRKTVKGKRPQFHEDNSSDKLMAMVMALAGEVSVMRDRLDTVERLLDANGTISRADIEAYRPDFGAIQEKEVLRKDLLAHVLYVFKEDVADVRGNETDAQFQKNIDDIAER